MSEETFLEDSKFLEGKFEEGRLEEESFQEESLQLVIFELSGEEFGIEVTQVSEIIPSSKITRIPLAPECIQGIINLRGKVVVVIDLNKRLDFVSKETDSLSKIIIVEVGDTIIGMPVNSVSEIISLPLSSIESVSEVVQSKINSEYLTGIGRTENRLFILLDLARIAGEGK